MYVVFLTILIVLVLIIFSEHKKNIKFTKTPNGSFYYDNDDYYISQAYRNGHIFEHELINNFILPHVKNCKHIVDLGANIGSHCIAYGNSNKTCKIYAFEPQNDLYTILHRNIVENKLSNVIIPYKKAIGHKNSTMKLQKVPEDTEFNKGGVGLGIDGEEVDVITLDSLNLEGCDLIKMDIQGAESLALIGGENTIKKFKPIIIFELDDSKINPADVGLEYIPEKTDLLKSYGYDIHQLDSTNYIATYI